MKREVKEYSLWVCCECDSEAMEHKDIIKHMRNVHNINTQNGKGTRKMLMHADARDFYKWKYEWDIEGLKFLQETCNKRNRPFGS